VSKFPASRQASCRPLAHRLAEGRREDGTNPSRLPSLSPLELLPLHLLLLQLLLGACMLPMLQRRTASVLVLVTGDL
jgi:hypothetical protein